MKLPRIEYFIRNLNQKGYMVLNGDGSYFMTFFFSFIYFFCIFFFYIVMFRMHIMFFYIFYFYWSILSLLIANYPNQNAHALKRILKVY